MDFNDKDISKNGNKFKRNKENKEKNKEFICEILFLLCGARSSQGLFLEFRRFRAEENQICFWSGFHETYSRGEGLKLQYREVII